jgi:hypothetical protein
LPLPATARDPGGGRAGDLCLLQFVRLGCSVLGRRPCNPSSSHITRGYAHDGTGGFHLRHELAHLFAFQWNTSAPPLVQEGLAVWLQGTTPDQTDTAEDIGSFLPFDTDPSLMLAPRYFFATNRIHLSYALAGGFTDFLIHRFG